MKLWEICLDTVVKIAGCPDSGLASVDWRRAKGLPEAHGDTVRMVWHGDDESAFRACVAAGMGIRSDADGGAEIRAVDNGGWPDTGSTRHGSWSEWRASIAPEIVSRHLAEGTAETAAAVIVAICDASRARREEHERREAEANARREAERIAREEEAKRRREERETEERHARAWLGRCGPTVEIRDMCTGTDATMAQIEAALDALASSDDDDDDES